MIHSNTLNILFIDDCNSELVILNCFASSARLDEYVSFPILLTFA